MLRFIYSFLLLIMLAGCATKTTIVNSVDERNASEIIVFLSSQGIIADRVSAPSSAVGGGSTVELWNIEVNADQALEAMSLLNRNGLPRQQGQDLLSLFGETGLVPTDMQQRIRYEAGLSQQLANTIRKIDGVLDASVQLSFPAEGSTEPITASVYIKYQGVLDNPNSQIVIKIKQFVSGAVTGLKMENVTVVTDRSRLTESPVGMELGTPPTEQNFVTIWGVNVEKDSLLLFRVFFFVFCFLVLLLIAGLIWVVWRSLPLVDQKGGVAYFWQSGKRTAHPKEVKPAETQPTQPTLPAALPPTTPPPPAPENETRPPNQ